AALSSAAGNHERAVEVPGGGAGELTTTRSLATARSPERIRERLLSPGGSETGPAGRGGACARPIRESEIPAGGYWPATCSLVVGRSLISIRRFFSRPAGVSFGWRGRLSENDTAPS